MVRNEQNAKHNPGPYNDWNHSLRCVPCMPLSVIAAHLSSPSRQQIAQCVSDFHSFCFPHSTECECFSDLSRYYIRQSWSPPTQLHHHSPLCPSLLKIVESQPKIDLFIYFNFAIRSQILISISIIVTSLVNWLLSELGATRLWKKFKSNIPPHYVRKLFALTH